MDQYLKSSPLQISAGVSLAALLAGVGYTLFLSQSEPGEFYSWIHRFLATLIAASLAFTSGLGVYLKQKHDREAKNKELLDSYLSYLIENLSGENDPQKVSIKYLNSRILNEIILSGQYNEAGTQLVRLQALIDNYILFSSQAIRRTARQNNKIRPWEKQNIENAAELIEEEARCCRRELQQLDA